jgi:hypothetical protein
MQPPYQLTTPALTSLMNQTANTPLIIHTISLVPRDLYVNEPRHTLRERVQLPTFQKPGQQFHWPQQRIIL